MSEPRKVYCTKYALTKGIEHLPVRDDRGDFLYLRQPGRSFDLQIRKNDAHDTLEDAQVRVREMVAAKLKSLDKQRQRLARIATHGAKVVEVKGE